MILLGFESRLQNRNGCNGTADGTHQRQCRQNKQELALVRSAQLIEGKQLGEIGPVAPDELEVQRYLAIGV